MTTLMIIQKLIIKTTQQELRLFAKSMELFKSTPQITQIKKEDAHSV